MMLKKLFVVMLILTAAIAAAIFIYRYEIIKYSAEQIIMSYLPDYVKVGRIDFDAKIGRVTIYDFRIVNPPEFSYKYLLEIDRISCNYKMKGKNPLDGFEIASPVFTAPLLIIERLADGKLNLVEMGEYLKAHEAGKAAAKKDAGTAPSKGSKREDVSLSQFLKLPERFMLEKGKVIFSDRMTPSLHVITFENIAATLDLKLKSDYSAVLNVTSTGEGNLNGYSDQTVKWNISYDPSTPKLTMSNRFDVFGLDLVVFEPYYDKYSPLTFRQGRFSGVLIFDFDNGNIGSSNEVHLSGLDFRVKEGRENSGFWGASVQDLAKYFTTTFGDVVFDFKIKGDMSQPRFYLGPISKQALTSMAVDKISDVISQMSSSGQQSQASGGEKSAVDQAKEYIELFKSLTEKK